MQYPNIAQPQYAFAPTMPMMAAGGKVQAENVRAQGRNNDSMLVHMTPNEVAGLQSLAMQHGGSLTINPQTGLPEAGFLENILPTLLGVGLSFIPGVGPMMAAGLVGGGTAIATGDISKGLMAGLGAFGGANLAAGLGAAGASAAAPTAGAGLPSAAGPTVTLPVSGDVSLASSFTGPSTAPLIDGGQSVMGQGVSAGLPAPTFSSNAAQAGRGFQNLVTGQPGSFDKFIGTAADAKTGAPATGLGGTAGAVRTAGMVASPFLTPEPYKPPTAESGEPPPQYTKTRAGPTFPATDRAADDSSEFNYFGPSQYARTGTMENPLTATTAGGPLGTALLDEERRRMMGGFGPYMAAKGGSVPQLENGGFVLTKKAVDGLGGGSNKKGQKVASRGLGAIPIKGPGTGTSDSIPTTIDGKHRALISNGEAYVPKAQVKKHGGAKKFYELMRKAERRA